jgi:2-dehydro-3-deoxygluconokinase
MNIRSAADTTWDCVALGEVMLRFDPGAGRVRTARQFAVWEGGGEYNVARALRKCFGRRAAVVTALPRSDLGLLVEDLIGQGGVDMRHVVWRDADGIGRDTRVGLNFVERGFGVRAPLGVSDRANSAASQLRPGEVNWDRIFGEEGVRWFHTGGIFAALSADTAQVVIEAIEAARKHGTLVSYDFNHRASLWNNQDATRATHRKIASLVDVMIGGPDDFARLGMTAPGLDGDRAPLDPANFKAAALKAVTEFPNLKVVASTLRDAKSASVNDWGAVLWADGVFHEAPPRRDLEIYDRIGGGDGFASGLIYAFLEGKGAQAAVEYGAAHGALAMTTPGDTSMASVAEVEAVMAGARAHVIR